MRPQAKGAIIDLRPHGKAFGFADSKKALLRQMRVNRNYYPVVIPSKTPPPPAPHPSTAPREDRDKNKKCIGCGRTGHVLKN